MTVDSSNTDEPTAESLLSDFKKELGDECQNVSDNQLLMFLRWKPSVDRAAERFRNFSKWKKENKDIFGPNLLVSKDSELERLLLSEVVIAPPNLTTHTGGPLLIGRMRNNDMTDGRTVDGVCRMAYYTIDRVLQRPAALTEGITVVHDLRGFSRTKNARVEVAKKLIGGAFGVFPIKINAIYVVDAPLVFVGFFKLVSVFMPRKLRERIHFISDFEELDVVDPKELLVEMGGTLEWSAREWVDEQKELETSGSRTSLTLTTVGVAPHETTTDSSSSTGDPTIKTRCDNSEEDEC